MITIPGFEVLEQVYESDNTNIFRGKTLGNGESVILKVLKNNYRTQGEPTRYRQEYEITKDLNFDRVAGARRLFTNNNTIVLVFDEFESSSLDHLIAQQDFSLENSLSLALQVAEALCDIHNAQIIHKNINPSNILVQSGTREIQIIDFGIATRLTQQRATIQVPNFLEGNLDYVSPEQTGKMNRPLDYRTDLYSLGATLYELFTGNRPFQGDDTMELVHSHIAKQPPAPHKVDSTIPAVVSDMVMRLMAKNPENRYQSAWGIAADLDQCVTQLNNRGTVHSFQLGGQDISNRLQFEKKLYGRSKELLSLSHIFQRGHYDYKEIILVTGPSGVGKSALVYEAFKPLREQGVYCIAGKFDQIQRHRPYSAVVGAFSQLIRLLLGESKDHLDRWRQRLLSVLGGNGQIIINVLPELELVIGPQPATPELDRSDAQHRFDYVLKNFIGAFCHPHRPLVIFLDDLQWADAATLKLIEIMMTNEAMHSLLLIGAYREHEIHPQDPLQKTINFLQTQDISISEFSLTGFNLDHIVHLIRETLSGDARAIEPLALLVLQKTQGNPLFVKEFLNALHQKRLLRYQPYRERPRIGHWTWDLNQIKQAAITDNVVDLMVDKIEKLPELTRQALQLAACIGNRFDLDYLALIHGKTPEQTYQDLSSALREDLIVSSNDLEAWDKSADCASAVKNYRFFHDRVQRACHALLDMDRRQTIHLKIGRLLLKSLSPQDRAERLFELADHLNEAQSLITDSHEVVEIARLNLAAGQKASKANAYSAALHYLQNGIRNLDKIDDSWNDYYELAFPLYEELASVEHLSGHFDRSLEVINLLLEKAKTVIEKAGIYSLLVWQYTVLTRHEDALQTGKKALALLGIDLPEQGLRALLDTEQQKIECILTGKPLSAYVSAELLAQPDKLAVLKLLASMAGAAYRSNQKLFAYIAIKMVQLSMTFGNAPESAFGYAIYGTTLVSLWKKYQLADQSCKVALELSEKLNDSAEKCKSSFAAANFVFPWTRPLGDSESTNIEGCRLGLESGTLQHVGYMKVKLLYHALYQGRNLGEIEAKISDALSFGKTTRNRWAIDVASALELNVHSLSHPGITNSDLQENSQKDVSFLKQCNTDRSFIAICLYYILKTQTLYLLGKPGEALATSKKAKKLLPFIGGMMAAAELNLYTSLSLTALYGDMKEDEKQRYKKTLIDNQNVMKLWVENCPQTFLNRYLLVEAECARIDGQDWLAVDYYDQAIASAEEHGFQQNKALASELAAKFWLAKGKENIARIYMADSVYDFKRWGAVAKLEVLQKENEQRLAGMPLVRPNGNGQTAAMLDIKAVVKASQAISKNIVLEKLLEDLMNLLLVFSGARKGLLILENDGQLFIEAEVTAGKGQSTFFQSAPIGPWENIETPLLPLSIINYVIHTKEGVVLNDGTKDEQFANDPYVVDNQPRSILCEPVIYQGKLNGILYLENNLAAAAFTTKRLEILQLLSGQAAISIENARLYGHLEKKVQRRTKQLQEVTANAEKAQRDAEQANQAKSAFLARMSHELRTPLNGVLGYAQILNKADDLSEKSKNAVQTIEQCGSHLLTLINDILDLSKIEAGKLELQPEAFQFPECLDTIREMIRIRAERKGLFFRYDTQTLLPKAVRGDENRICQILVNLLANAVKFTRQGGVYLRIHYKENEVRFEVEDTGIGISQQQLPKIFEPFYNIDEEIAEGTGLGLAITKELVDAMGGRLEIESTVGKGTLFRIHIKLPEVAMAETEIRQPCRQIIGYHGHCRKVLLVDDKLVNRRMIADVLTPLGFEISEAENGIDAITKVRIDRPDIIFMDLVMPKLDGLATTSRLRSQPGIDKIKILAISASSYDYNKQQALAAGCDDFISKPIQIDILIEKLGELLALQWRYQQSDAPTPNESDQPLVIPVPTDLEELRKFAISGDVEALIDKSSRLEKIDASLKPFAIKLRSLAQDFKLREIRRFLDSSPSNGDIK